MGCGTGSNLRATAPLLGAEQHWTLVDHDPAPARRGGCAPHGLGHRGERQRRQLVLQKGGKRITVAFRRVDLAHDLEQCLCRRARSRHGVGAVRSGFGRFHRRGCGRGGAPQGGLLHRAHLQRPAALEPKHEADTAMAAAFRAHQVRDKGFGAAAGPMAPALLAPPSTRRATGQRGRQRVAAGSGRRGIDRRAGRDLPAPCGKPGRWRKPEIAEWLKVAARAALSATPIRWRCRRSAVGKLALIGRLTPRPAPPRQEKGIVTSRREGPG